jgi:DNA-directed RNA polymerase specialized sigma24 family protein
MRRLPDPELIALARDGSAEAAGALFDRYWVLAWGAAYAVTADRALADDAAQEAIERAFRTLDRFDETRPFGPWLKRIGIRLCGGLGVRQGAAIHRAELRLVRLPLGRGPQKGVPARHAETR